MSVDVSPVSYSDSESDSDSYHLKLVLFVSATFLLVEPSNVHLGSFSPIFRGGGGGGF